MIFNRFFRSKHLDPKPQVRIKAIEQLDKELSAQKSILHELAFNDPDASVSLAALQKLDSFALWYKMSETGKDERVTKKSLQMVEKKLFDQADNSLSEKEKRNFISQCKDNRLLEKLLWLPWVQVDAALVQNLLNKLAKPQVSEKVLLETSNHELQISLLSQLKDEPASHKIISKLLKKSTSEPLKQQASALLQQWHQQQQLPISVEKDTRMLLSLLLALKDSQDLDHIRSQQQQLSAQYEALAAQFECLTQAKQQEFADKWRELNGKLQKTIDTLAPQWQAQQQQLAQQAATDSLLQECEQLVQQLETQLKQPMLEWNNEQLLSQQGQLSTAYERTQAQLADLGDTHRKERQALIVMAERIANCQQTLADLPAYHACLQQSRDLISQFGELSAPNDISQLDAAEQYLREVKNQWRNTTQPFNQNLPADMRQQWQQLTGNWQAAIKQLNSQITQDLNRCRSKLRAIEGLINQGRFRLAMDLYTRANAWFAQLPEKQQAMLDKNYQQVKQQIENLKDWQEYIAAPRKPALLAEAERLAANPLAIEQQASAVKTLRQQWNSLGVIDSESDQALNQAFDATIEQAFAPCRLHYEKQQQLREQNLHSKQAVLQALQQLNEGNETGQNLSKQLRSLQDQWRKTGEVEFKLRNELNEQYLQATGPLKQKVHDFYQANAEQKQQLLDKAIKCLDMDSLDSAIEQIKKLQQQWKTIEHAGKKAEAELWPKFRAASDAVFAKRQAQQAEFKQNLNEQLKQVKALIKTMQQAVEQAQDKAALDASDALKAEIIAACETLPEKERMSFARQLSDIEDAIKKREQSLGSAQSKQQYAAIFAALEAWQSQTEVPEIVNTLPNSWQQAFQTPATQSAQDRHALTIMLEIISEQDSPKSDATKRQALQMQLMAQKLQDGHLDSADELLKQWIACGPLRADQVGLLARVQGLFA